MCLLSWVTDVWWPRALLTLVGDSSDVQDQLKNVQQVQASHFAFAAILMDLW